MDIQEFYQFLARKTLGSYRAKKSLKKLIPPTIESYMCLKPEHSERKREAIKVI